MATKASVINLLKNGDLKNMQYMLAKNQLVLKTQFIKKT